MREVENLPFGPTARWTSLNLVGSSTYGKKTEEVAEGDTTTQTYESDAPAQARTRVNSKNTIYTNLSPRKLEKRPRAFFRTLEKPMERPQTGFL